MVLLYFSAKKRGNGSEGEIYSVYAGKIWILRGGFDESFFAGQCNGGNDSFPFYKMGIFIHNSFGCAYICVFPDVFQKLSETVRGKSNLFKIYFQNTGQMVCGEKPDGAAEDASYL